MSQRVNLLLYLKSFSLFGFNSRKLKTLGTLLHETAKGALIRARFSLLNDMDAPSSFFFNLEKNEMERKLRTL